MALKHKLNFIDLELDQVKQKNLYRKLRYGKVQGSHITINNKKLLNLSSNDYLGIPIRKNQIKQLQSSSRSVSGNDESYKKLETKLAKHKSQQNSLVFPTGYMTNLGVISSIAKKGDIIFSDELNHASIIESCKLSDANISVYKHNDMEDLKIKLKQKGKNKFVITEGVFSMDGDLSHLKQITEIAEKSEAITIVDDAHGDFVIGKDGKGTPNYFKVSKKIDLYISSLSKGLGSFGGYVASQNNVIDLCINKSKSFIYTSALPSFLIEHTLQRFESNREKQKKKLEYHKVEEIICVTATPFTEMVSTTDFNEIKEIEPGEGYIGIDQTLKEPVELENEDITEFNSGILSPEIMQILSSENSKKNTVTLISTTTRMEGHKLQCHAIEKYLNDPKTLVVELNSNKGNKYFSPGMEGILFQPYYGSRGDQLAQLFSVANNFEKLFIVGGGMLDRSVTLKSKKFNSFSGYIYSAGREVALSSLLQKASRTCGYQDFIPQFYTDVGSKMYLAKIDYPKYIKITQDNPKALERRIELLSVNRLDVNYKRPLGRHRHNNTTDKSSPRSTQCITKTPEEAERLNYKILNELKEFKSNDLPEDVLKQLQDNKRAQRGTPLQRFIWDNFPLSNRILNVRGIEDGDLDYFRWQLPNNKIADLYRDTLYGWHKDTLSISVQPYQTVRGKYAVQNIITKDFNCYNEEGAFAQAEG